MHEEEEQIRSHSCTSLAGGSFAWSFFGATVGAMEKSGTWVARFCRRLRWLLGAMGVTGLLVLTWWLRHRSFSSDPLLYTYLEFGGSLLSFTYAANALVRFR